MCSRVTHSDNFMCFYCSKITSFSLRVIRNDNNSEYAEHLKFSGFLLRQTLNALTEQMKTGKLITHRKHIRISLLRDRRKKS